MPINDVQTTNRQHAVPQNIMDVEFKIIGDLTMRQFIYLLIFGGLGYASFIIIPGLLKWPVIIVSALAGVAFAFLPIEERGLDEWVINFIKAMYKDNQMIWRKSPEVPTAFSFENLDVVKHELITLTPTSSRRKLEEFLDKQDFEVQVDPLDIPEDSYIDKVREVYASAPIDAPVQTPVQATSTKEKPAAQTQQQNKDSAKDVKKEDKEAAKVEEYKHDIKEGDITIKQAQQQAANKQQVAAQRQEETPQPRKKLLTPITGTKPKPRKQSYTNPMTPDRHTGRRFTNLLPKQGEIVLPIRGEKVLQTTQEQKIQSDIDEKAAQLKQLLEQIKSDEQYSKVVTPTKEKPTAQLQQQTQETPNPTEQKVPTQPQSTENENKQSQNMEANKQQSDDNNARNNAQPLQNNTQAQLTTPPVQNNTSETIKATSAQMNPLSDKPNVITGIVKGPDSNALEGLVLIIKNDKDEPVRALKTNQLGQFAISTPLSNGTYTIETDKSKKTNLTFAIISFEATGAVIPPVEIKGL